MSRIRSAAFSAFAACAVVATAAFAAPDDAVDVKLAAKVGDVLRFRQTSLSGTEVDGVTTTSVDYSQEYSVTVKVVRPDGGLDVEVRIETIKNKILRRGTTVEVDTSKPAPADLQGPATQIDPMMRALIDRPLTITLDAHGKPTAITGFREAIKAGTEGTAAAVVPVDKAFPDTECMKVARALFFGAPEAAHAVASKWNGETQDYVGSEAFDFSYEATLTSATPEQAVVAAKYTWKPPAKATEGGTKPDGGGEVVSTFDRKDGFLVACKKHLELNLASEARKARLHTDATIERLPPKPK